MINIIELPITIRSMGTIGEGLFQKKQVESGVKPLFSFVIMLMSACFGMNCFL